MKLSRVKVYGHSDDVTVIKCWDMDDKLVLSDEVYKKIEIFAQPYVWTFGWGDGWELTCRIDKEEMGFVAAYTIDIDNSESPYSPCLDIAVHEIHRDEFSIEIPELFGAEAKFKQVMIRYDIDERDLDELKEELEKIGVLKLN